MLYDSQCAHFIEAFFQCTRLTHFPALCEGHHAKWRAGVITLAHHVHIAHFKDA